MRAMVLRRSGEKLQLEDVPDPAPGADQILFAVEACGVCRIDLHIVDGELTQPKLPLVPGHEIVGRVVRVGDGVTGFTTGMRAKTTAFHLHEANDVLDRLRSGNITGAAFLTP